MEFVRSRAGEAGALKTTEAAARLLSAAKGLEPLDDDLARETYLEALSAAMYAGRLGEPGRLAEIADAARRALGRVARTAAADRPAVEWPGRSDPRWSRWWIRAPALRSGTVERTHAAGRRQTRGVAVPDCAGIRRARALGRLRPAADRHRHGSARTRHRCARGHSACAHLSGRRPCVQGRIDHGGKVHRRGRRDHRVDGERAGEVSLAESRGVAGECRRRHPPDRGGRGGWRRQGRGPVGRGEQVHLCRALQRARSL